MSDQNIGIPDNPPDGQASAGAVQQDNGVDLALGFGGGGSYGLLTLLGVGA